MSTPRNGHELVLAPERQPATVESEVIRLRAECTAILRELEGRVERVIAWPGEMKKKVVSFEQQVIAYMKRRPSLMLGLGIAAGALLLGSLVAGKAVTYAREERRPRARTADALHGAIRFLFGR